MNKTVILPALSLLLFISFSCSSKEVHLPLAPEDKAAAPLKEAWQVEWDKVVAEARKEGRVSVYGPPWGDLRRLLTDAFKKAYPGVELEYIGLEGRNLAPRVMTERRGGIYMADIIIAGTTTILSVFKDMALPIEPVITLPETRDPKAWLNGKFEFADSEGKINLVFVAQVYHYRSKIDTKKG